MLGQTPRLKPVLLGAIFGWRGHGSWALTDERAGGMAEIERRADRYGLPPLAWPDGWPGNSLAAMRAAVWAGHQGRDRAFARAVYHAQFAQAADLSQIDVLCACADEAGLDGAALPTAIADPAIKDELRAATQAAWDAGVRGVPTVIAGDRVFFGDDQLELAASTATAD